MSEEPSKTARELLRHTLATLAYRANKALRDAPPEFRDFRVGNTSRTPGEILAHVGDLMDWAIWMSRGEYRWQVSDSLPWSDEVDRFFSRVATLDAELLERQALGFSEERIFQGPIADALTHIGQIAMLRRLAGSPVRGENYFRANIETGRVGSDQPSPVREFD